MTPLPWNSKERRLLPQKGKRPKNCEILTANALRSSLSLSLSLSLSGPIELPRNPLSAADTVIRLVSLSPSRGGVDSRSQPPPPLPRHDSRRCPRVPLSPLPEKVTGIYLGLDKLQSGYVKLRENDPSSNPVAVHMVVSSFNYHANFRTVTKPSRTVPKLQCTKRRAVPV